MSKYSEQGVDMGNKSKDQKTIVYIDAANLEKGMLKVSDKFDLARFFVWLQEKHNATDVYIFIGFIEKYQSKYERLKKIGYKIIFKETYKTKTHKIKGNCDAELILAASIDFYEKLLKTGILVSGDGDFSCLIDFWKNKGVFPKIISPNRRFCSLFLKRKNVSLTFLEDLFENFEKPPLETKL